MQKSEYRRAAAISQSVIKKFRSMSLPKFKEVYIDKVSQEEEDTSDSLTTGSLTDTIAFEPKLVDERFYLPGKRVEIPGEKVKIILDRVYRQAQDLVDTKILLNRQGNVPEQLYVPDISELGEFRDNILKVAREINFGGKNWTNSTILEKVYEGKPYYYALIEAKGRTIIDTVDSADAHEMVKALQTHPRSKAFFVQQEGEVLLFQQEIYEQYAYDGIDIPLKCATDIIRIVPAEKLIYLVDLKTIYDVREFKEHSRKYGYLEQMSFYRYMLRRFLTTYRGGIYKEFTIVTPFDIAIDAVTKVPNVFDFDESDLEIIEYGSEKHGIKGWRATLEEIGWHIKNKVWTESKEMHQTGKIKLKFFHD